MISVAISTYNGSRFIIHQLESILKQTVLPNEIVIIDDCSTDNTFELIQAYINKHPEVFWNISKNDTNVGWKINFKNCLFKTKGDIIFIADQDDYWFRNKIELMVDVMKRCQFISVLGANFEVVHNTNCMILDALKGGNNREVVKQNFDSFFYMITCPGANLAIRRHTLQWFNACIWDTTTPHDELMWIMGKITESAYVLKEKTMFYCRYEDAETYRNKPNKNDRLSFLNNKIILVEKCYNFLREHSDIVMAEKKIIVVSKVRKFLKTELNYINKYNISDFLYLVLNINMYQHKSRLLGDIYYSLSK